ncbi:MAG: serine O-acetyltransferase [Candidatus Hodgkinia cicadicola]
MLNKAINTFILSRLLIERLSVDHTLPINNNYLAVALKLMINKALFILQGNITSSHTWSLILSDIIASYFKDPSCLTISSIIRKPGTKVLIWFRLSAIQIPSIAAVLLKVVSSLHNVDINHGTLIGPFCCIDHANCIIIGQQAQLAWNILIMHGTTLGSLGERLSTGSIRHPVIMSGVSIGAHSSVLGNIIIGHCVTVAANSTISKFILPYNTVLGSPARLLC